MANKKDGKIVVEREIYEKNGKQYFSYFVKGNIRGKEVKANVMPLDFGGYAVLDIVFGDENSVNLVLNAYEIKDEKTGNVMRGNTYSVRSTDENGEIYECRIKPAKNSDKALLNMILR